MAIHSTIKTFETFNDTTMLVYVNNDAGISASIFLHGLRTAHNADLGVGCHPYASATAWTSVSLLPTLAPVDISAEDLPIVEDYLEWCDDVFARYEEHSADESIASSAQQTGAITDARFADEVNVQLAREDLDIATRPLDLDGIRAVTRFATNHGSAVACAIA